MSEIFTGKAFVVVAGASRGIGKAIAETFASHLKNDSRVLLMARNAENLKKVADEMPKGLVTTCKSIDFSNTTANELQASLQEALKGEKPENFNQAVIIHCAAMINHSQKINDLTDFDKIQPYFNANVFSPAVLNGHFMKTFNSSSVNKYVVNICSYWGLNPSINVGSYCAAKAAKDMLFKTFALENPDVRVLNYLPGYVETDMFYDAYNTSDNDKLKEKIKVSLQNKVVATPAMTAECLVDVLKRQEYKSGDYVDFLKINNLTIH